MLVKEKSSECTVYKQLPAKRASIKDIIVEAITLLFFTVFVLGMCFAVYMDSSSFDHPRGRGAWLLILVPSPILKLVFFSCAAAGIYSLFKEFLETLATRKRRAKKRKK
jgi:hypothetical protein